MQENELLIILVFQILTTGKLEKSSNSLVAFYLAHWRNTRRSSLQWKFVSRSYNKQKLKHLQNQRIRCQHLLCMFMYSICTGITGLFTYWLTTCTLYCTCMKHTYPSCSFQTSLLWLQLFCWISCCKAFHWELVTRDHSDKLVALEVEILKFPENKYLL